MSNVFGGFDSHTLPPQNGKQSGKQLVSSFLKSRREGLSPRTLEFYNCYLNNSSHVIGLQVTGQDIAQFINSLGCTNGGKHAYHRVLRAFYNWLYSPKSGMNLNPQNNPILAVDAPKVEKKILPSLTIEQVEYLIDQSEKVRDKAIISLFTDSGLRLSELAIIKIEDIDWDRCLIKVKCKGNKEAFAVFGSTTLKYLKDWIAQIPPPKGDIYLEVFDLSGDVISLRLGV